jgi:hypothetical protein
MTSNEVQEYVDELTSLARQLNTFTSGLKTVRAGQPKKKHADIRESVQEYLIDSPEGLSDLLFFEDDLQALKI